MTTNQKIEVAHEVRMYGKEIFILVIVVMVIFEAHPEWKAAIKTKGEQVKDKFKEVFSKKEA